MKLELKVPEVGESITEVEIGDWLKPKGAQVRKDEPIVSLESEKATVELPAPEAGTITETLKQKGETAKIGEVIAFLETDGQVAAAPAPAKAPENKPAAKSPAPTPEAKPAPQPAGDQRVMPAAQRVMAEQGLTPESVKGTGPGGRILKEDVLKTASSQAPEPAPPAGTEFLKRPVSQAVETSAPSADRQEEVVPMSRLRRTVAERLVQAQHTAALLTTFNEVDMGNVMALRKEYGDAFHQKYNIKLGFMSFFVKASIEASKQFPALNAEIRGNNIVYHNFFDIGVAIGSGKGLVVPALRNAERMSFAEIELAIADLAKRARDNKLKVEELQGGTFTISNGGVYGSLLSTPIVNPPQSGVLGLHAIQDRPVAREGNVVIRPIMYVALTYDHRLIDGREAVSWLKRLKDLIENPARILIEV
jgi:2-oxoglutarate dehydrogenase E2 component (dihydrolipoamide succinyltransferase)